MSFSPVYLVERFFYRAFDFFHHWYVDGSRWFGRRFIGALQRLDRTFALRITLHHFFEPLYRDYSVIGRILGVVFRTFRIGIAVAIYVAIALLFCVIYLLWLAIPAFIIFRIIYG